MKKLLTPKQVARALGVSESSVKRWCDQDRIPTIRTGGGHRRLPIEGVISFLRDDARALVRPELLGLPRHTGQGTPVLHRATDRLHEALVAGDEEIVRHVLLDLYLAGHRTSAICDQVLAPAFARIGDRWSCAEVEVYQERRACALALRAAHELRSVLAPVGTPAPVAVGGTLEGDHYELPTAAVELVLRENGWAATSLGASLPVATLKAALQTIRPRLFWLSASSVADRAAFLEWTASLYDSATSVGTAMVVGGNALDESLRRELRYSAYCDNLAHLEAFIATLPTDR